jgi:REP-associated tyrosine transposase
MPRGATSGARPCDGCVTQLTQLRKRCPRKRARVAVVLHRVCVARSHRDKAAGIFHVYTHGVWAADELYRDDVDRMAFLRELVRAGVKVAWDCLAFCLMDTHYHLLLEVDDGALPRGMHSLNFRYAMQFNHRYAMRGHVMGARYDSVRIEDDEHLRNAFKYVALNPVEAGLVQAPADWPWSTYAGTVGLAAPHTFVADDRVLSALNTTSARAIRALRAFVEES